MSLVLPNLENFLHYILYTCIFVEWDEYKHSMYTGETNPRQWHFACSKWAWAITLFELRFCVQEWVQESRGKLHRIIVLHMVALHQSSVKYSSIVDIDRASGKEDQNND